MIDHSIEGKTVLIAGGAKNLGGLIARDLASRAPRLSPFTIMMLPQCLRRSKLWRQSKHAVPTQWLFRAICAQLQPLRRFCGDYFSDWQARYRHQYGGQGIEKADP